MAQLIASGRMIPPGDTIGLIGTGLMGTAIVERLLAAGFRVRGWDRDADCLAASCAEAAESAAAVLRSCNCVVLSLPDSRVAEAVLDEVGAELRPGQLILDTTTGEPVDAVRFAERLRPLGVAYLDATVSGSSEQLRSGNALCMVGGEAADYARCAGLFEAFGGSVIHVGACGHGARMKLVTNLVLGLNRAALAEGLALAEGMGLDLRQTLHVLQSSAAASRIMDSKGRKMIEREFSPVARLSQHLKDVRLIQQAGDSAGLRLPLTEAHRRLLEQAETVGLGAEDNSAVIEVIRKRAS
ncbi:MAG: NAD(P)-dependent oxidoreductase [Verrucomicrobia bacterium]|nr:NAD(P)-dependent oxidoreductase [Verrucomicrobiota bacterium]